MKNSTTHTYTNFIKINYQNHSFAFLGGIKNHFDHINI